MKWSFVCGEHVSTVPNECQHKKEHSTHNESGRKQNNLIFCWIINYMTSSSPSTPFEEATGASEGELYNVQVLSWHESLQCWQDWNELQRILSQNKRKCQQHLQGMHSHMGTRVYAAVDYVRRIAIHHPEQVRQFVYLSLTHQSCD